MDTMKYTTENSEVDLDQIIRDLNVGANKLPEEAIRAAQKHPELITPRLIQVLRDATAKVASGDFPEGNAHFIALFLLAEFRAKEALPAILDAISLPGEGPFDLFGDAVTESLSHVLAALADDSLDTVESLIANRSLNLYVRWGAAQTYLHYVRSGLLTREEAVDRLRHHLREAMENKDDEFAEGIISELISYSPHEAMADIREAYRRDIIDPFMVSLDDVERSISEGQDHLQKEMERIGPPGFTDTVEELKDWAAFRAQPIPKPHVTPEFSGGDLNDAWDDRPLPASSTIRNTAPKVGRNDPCPCGSGKKYKKCCGAG